MKRSFYLLLLVATMLQSCKSTKETETATNPFFSDYGTPFESPDFSKIKHEHFIPAFNEGMRQQKEEIEKIINNPEAPNFKNTIEALEMSGQLLTKISTVFGHYRGSSISDEINAIAKEITPKLTAHSNYINLNEKLFARVKAVYESDEELTTEQKFVLKKYYNGFVRGGANLSPEQKERFKKISEELSLLSMQFGENLLKATNEYKLVIDNEKDLSGLPAGVIAAASDAAKSFNMEGKWVFTLHNPSMIPFLQYADNRDLREQIYKAYINRCSKDSQYNNWDIISKIVSLRVEKANLLGFKDHASFILDNNMAKTPENVYKLCRQIWDAALPISKREAAKLQEQIKKEGGKFKLQGWDWRYYAEKIKKAEYGLDESELSQYFKLENVRQGAFDVATKLYGITFHERKDIPKSHEEAIAFEVKDAAGNHVALFIADYFPRASKRSGAWMTDLRGQSHLLNSRPIITNTCNFTKPTGDTPSLLTYDEVLTLFHEFGHAIHGMLADTKYPSTSGTSVARDFVELPSQIMENWAADPQVMKQYARHWKTGEVIPDELIEKLQKSAHFNQGFSVTEFMSAALLDMAYHTIQSTEVIDAEKFEKDFLKELGLIPEITVRYRSPYFSHIFNGGYSSGYYGYTWAEVLDADAFAAFKETGDIFNPDVAKAFKDNILTKGGTDDPMKLYIQFRGHEPSTDALLVRKGLLTPSDKK